MRKKMNSEIVRSMRDGVYRFAGPGEGDADEAAGV
jgi:hypothetical protein